MGKLSSITSGGGSSGGGSGSGATPAEAAQIAQNTTDIAANATAAANAATDASNAAAAAATNATAIAASVTAISSNDTDISDNAADIVANATAIAANATAAADAATAAANAAAAAATNATAIATNASDIDANEAAILGAKGFQTIQTTGDYATSSATLDVPKPLYIRAVGAFTLTGGTGTTGNIGRAVFVYNDSASDLSISLASPVSAEGNLTISPTESLAIICTGVDTFDVLGGK